MRKHTKISSQERDKIAWWFYCGIKVREIARRLGRSHSSILAEIKRNSIDGTYWSIKAQRAAEARKHNQHRKYLLKTNPTLLNFLKEKLDLGWSPQQRAGRLKKEIVDGIRSQTDYINHESIYQYLYDPLQKDEKLWSKLPRAHNKRRRWLGRRSRKVTIPYRISIRNRPPEIDKRIEFGHWEGDTIVGHKYKTGIHTEVERVSRFILASKVQKIKAQEVSLAQLVLFNNLAQEARKSITLDNGHEHAFHTRLQKFLGMQTYFADPYCFWQRGTNESINGWIRRYFPKKTDFSG